MFLNNNQMFLIVLLFTIIRHVDGRRIKNVDSDVKTLIATNILYRHGGRAPCKFYPKYEGIEEKWPNGAGWLTRKGMQVEYDLGLFLRKRYVVDKKLINERYDHREVRLQSSSRERCVQSAQLQMAGLFPPKGNQVWNKDLLWQPVPFTSVPKEDDSLMRPFEDDCPRRKQIWSELRKSPESLQKAAENVDLFRYLSNYTGLNVTMKNFWIIKDTINSERFEGLIVPRWAEIVSVRLTKLDDWSVEHRFKTKSNELSRLLGGPLLAKIMNDMMNIVDQDGAGDRSADKKQFFKMNLYSAHDQTILSLSSALRLNISLPINFAACVMIELYHSKKNGYEVQMYLHNVDTGAADNPVPIKLKGCSYSCPIRKFYLLNKERLSTNRVEECKVR